jgi:trk system potassium uptake protein TrkH
MQLFKVEVPGPQTDKLAPRIGETTKPLWRVYLLLWVILFGLLLLGGMSAFESICHTFATMDTGGFSTRAASVAGFGSAYVEWVLMVFMMVAGTNSTLHFMALRGRLTVYGKDLEWRAHMAIIVVSTGLIILAFSAQMKTGATAETVRMSAFQAVSIVTTTGHASADFESWPDLAILTLLALMFVGGMAGSTAGGFKVVRHPLVFKTWTRELFYLVHPRGVQPIPLAHRVVPSPVIRAMAAFAGAYFTILTLGTFFCFGWPRPGDCLYLQRIEFGQYWARTWRHWALRQLCWVEHDCQVGQCLIDAPWTSRTLHSAGFAEPVFFWRR